MDNILNADMAFYSVIIVAVAYGLMILYLLFFKHYIGKAFKEDVEEVMSIIENILKDGECSKYTNNDDAIIIYFNKINDKNDFIVCYYKHSHKVVIRVFDRIEKFQFKKKFYGAESSYLENSLISIYKNNRAPWYK